MDPVDPKRFAAVGPKRAGATWMLPLRAESAERIAGGSVLAADVEQPFLRGSAPFSRLRRDIPDVHGARALATIRHGHQEKLGEAVGGIGSLGAAAGAGGVAALHRVLDEAEGWLHERGVVRAIAPYDHFLFSEPLWIADPPELPAFPFFGGQPEIREVLEARGYEQWKPWMSFRIDLATAPLEAAIDALADDVTIRPLDRSRWSQEMALTADMLDRSFVPEWEHHPFDHAVVEATFGGLERLVDPGEWVFAELDGEPVGVCCSLPDLAEAVHRGNGALGPLTLARMLWRTRRPRAGGVLFIGVTPEGRRRGIARALAASTLRRLRERGATEGLYHLVNEDNVGSRGVAESLGGVGRVVAATYAKAL